MRDRSGSRLPVAEPASSRRRGVRSGFPGAGWKPALHALIAVCLLFAVASALAQDDPTDAPPGAQPADSTAPDQPAVDGSARRIGDPFEAYAAGSYDQALQGFVDRQVERPEDLALTFNIGSAQYQMKSYAEAENAFAQVAVSADQGLREQALYNLGNCAFRQGRLEQAVELYMAALDIDPDDADAKFNLEFVRDEIRRRHEEAKKRQEQQQQQQQQQQEQQQQGEQQQEQQQQAGGQGQPEQQDSDRDGLSDQVEREGENPTDPHDSDSDDDGLLDGQEDANANGRVDPGETDPNDPDSDDDGTSDGAEALEGQQPPPEEQGQQGEEGEQELSKEEAERYLQSLEEGRPQQQQPAQQGRPRRPEKDW